jgi:SAM-dependent methyltransferase
MVCNGHQEAYFTRKDTAVVNAGVSYVRCPACGLISLASGSQPPDITELYPDTYYGKEGRKFCASAESARKMSTALRVRFMRRYLAAGCGRVLDIGCGNGSFLRAMSVQGYAIFATELPGPMFEAAKGVPHIELHAADSLTEDLFPARYFDAITLWHSLEHMFTPRSLISWCRKWLKPEGLLCIEVPNCDSWQARIFQDKWFHLDCPRHRFCFTPFSLQRLLEQEGFSVTVKESFSFEMGLYGALQSMLNSLMSPANLLYDMLRLGKSCQAHLLRKAETLLLAPILLPAALGLMSLETVCGAGAVLRYACKVRQP